MKSPASPAAESSGLEGRRALLFALQMAGAAAFILCGYEVFRSSAQTLFLKAYGKHTLPLGMGMVPIGITLLLYIYGRLLSFAGPRRTFRITTLGAMATILICYTGIRLGIRPFSFALYLFKESYIVLLIEQIWSFINSRLSRTSARRFNGPITGVAGLGAIAGGSLLQLLAERWGTLHMLPLAACVSLPGLLLAELAYRRYGEPQREPVTDPTAAAPGGSHLGLGLFRTQRILPILFGLVVCSQLIAAAGEQLFTNNLIDRIPSPDQQTAYSGRFYRTVNLVAMAGQFILTPLILRFLHPALLQVIIPCVHLVTFSLVLGSPSLERAELAFLLFKACDYSLFRAAKELLYVPLSFDVRYRAKEVIDVLGYRFSKGATSITIHFLKSTGTVLSSPALATLALVGGSLWLLLVIPLSRLAKTKDA